MSSHPFTHSYLGLGLLDPDSIHRVGRTWAAEYRDGEEPYLRLTVGPNRCRVEEFDETGTRVAMSGGPNQGIALTAHARGAVDGTRDLSRFWLRVLRHGPPVYITLQSDTVMAYVPAFGIGLLRVPIPPGRTWVEPEPTPIEQRVGTAGRDPFGPRTGILLRWYAGRPAPTELRIRILQYLVTGIVVNEFARAIEAANPLQAIEWRPFVEIEPEKTVGRRWGVTERWQEHPEGRLLGFAIIEEPPARETTLARTRPEAAGGQVKRRHGRRARTSNDATAAAR